VLLPRQRFKLARGANDKERAMSQISKTVGIDIGKNSFHVVGHDERGAIVLRQKWSRGPLLYFRRNRWPFGVLSLISKKGSAAP